MKKFKGMMLGMAMGVVVFGLTGCISAPPEEAAVTPTSTQTVQETAPTAKEDTSSTEVAPEVKENDGSYKVVVKASAGEFAPSEEMKQVMTGDASGLGFNHVYVMTDDDKALADALAAGHFYVSATENGPSIQIKGKERIMGDQVSMADEKIFKVEVKGLKSGSIVKVINQEGVVEEKKVMGDKYDTRVTVTQEGFYFVEVWGGDGKLVALTNPMYVTP